MHWDSTSSILFLAENTVSYIAKLLPRIQNTNSCVCDSRILIELLCSKLSKLEGLELAYQNYCTCLATFLPSATSNEMCLKCCLRDTITITWYYNSISENMKLFTNFCTTKTKIIICTWPICKQSNLSLPDTMI